MSDLAKFLVDQGGVWGVIAVALAGALLYKERETQRVRKEAAADLQALLSKLDAEHAARLNDAKENTKALLEIAERTHEALENLTSVPPPPRR